MVVPPKHLKMIIFGRKNQWLLGTTILGNPHMSQKHLRFSICGRIFWQTFAPLFPRSPKIVESAVSKWVFAARRPGEMVVFSSSVCVRQCLLMVSFCEIREEKCIQYSRSIWFGVAPGVTLILLSYKAWWTWSICSFTFAHCDVFLCIFDRHQTYEPTSNQCWILFILPFEPILR